MANPENSVSTTKKETPARKVTKHGQPIPTIQELNSSDPKLAFENDQLKLLLYQDPNPKFLKPHPTATKKVKNSMGVVQNVPMEYLPIDKVEFFLDYIFQRWRIEVLREGAIYNAVYVTVRVHYYDIVNNEWTYHDGVGANTLQLKSGSTPGDMNNLQHGAVQMGLPAAKSYAIKDACDHIGRVFGRDVNRSDVQEFVTTYAPPEFGGVDKEEERIEIMIEAAKTRAQLKSLEPHLSTPQHRELYDNKFQILK